jgi:hypothetical protein
MNGKRFFIASVAKQTTEIRRATEMKKLIRRAGVGKFITKALKKLRGTKPDTCMRNKSTKNAFGIYVRNAHSADAWNGTEKECNGLRCRHVCIDAQRAARGK